jgi:Protein kinase domain
VSNGHEVGVVMTLETSELSRGASRRLRQAVSVRASMSHSNLVRAWPLGQADGRLLVGLERASHPTLAERLAAAPLEPVEAIRILDGLAAGAAALQERGLVPWDVTPDNVLVHPSDGGILMDLAIAPVLLRRVPRERDSQLAFRSPEELGGGRIDTRSCVYSVGAMLFAALTGVQPSEGVDDGRSARRPPLPSERRADLVPEIDQVVARAMATDPADRYADVGEVSRAAAAALGLNTVRITAPSNGTTATRRRRQPSPSRGSMTPSQRNGARPDSTRGTEAPPTRQRPKPRPADKRPSSPPAEARTRMSASEVPAMRVPERRALAAVGRRCAELVVALLAVAVAAGERLQHRVYRFAGGMAPAARAIRGALVRATRGSGEVTRGMLAQVGRVPGPLARRGAELAAGLADRAQGPVHRRSEAVRHFKLALFAVGALAACALAGTAIGSAMDAKKEGPSFVARSGMRVQLPPGWKEASVDGGSSAVPATLAAAPTEESKAGLVAGKLDSEAAAERIMQAHQGDGQGRIPVRLGSLYAWRYAGLRPRPHLVGSGYVVPTTAGAVVFICHAARNEAPMRLDECERAATTLTIRGERPRPLSALSRSEEH